MAFGNLNVDTVTTSTAGGVLGAGNASIMKNRIINGSFVINQRGFSGAITSDNLYTLDRWYMQASQASKLTVSQNAGSVTPPVGFSNYFGATSSAATSLGASDYFAITQVVEGFNMADLGWGTASAKTVTLSFQVYSSLTGTFGGCITNGTFNYSYPFTYSIPVANTWTTISVTVAGPTSGTWVGATNGKGMYVQFGLGVGSGYSGTAGSWTANGYVSATGATSVVGTNGATFYITGVQLEVGSSATGYEYRQYGQELALCQRYFCIFGADATSADTYQAFAMGLVYNATTVRGVFSTPVNMRSSPSVSYSGNLRTYDGSTSSPVSAVSIDTNNLKTPYLSFTTSGMTTGRSSVISQNADSTAKVLLSAEL